MKYFTNSFLYYQQGNKSLTFFVEMNVIYINNLF